MFPTRVLERSALSSTPLAMSAGEWPITPRWSACWGQGFVVEIKLYSYSILCPSLVLNGCLGKRRVSDKQHGASKITGTTVRGLVGTEGELGPAWAHDDLAEEVQDFSIMKLHLGTFSPVMISLTLTAEKEDDSWERKRWNKRWNKELERLVFVQNAWLRKKPTCCVMHAFFLHAKSSESL